MHYSCVQAYIAHALRENFHTCSYGDYSKTVWPLGKAFEPLHSTYSLVATPCFCSDSRSDADFGWRSCSHRTYNCSWLQGLHKEREQQPLRKRQRRKGSGPL